MEQKTIKVLYIDDEQINLDLLKFHFEGVFDVFTCNSGDDGLQILEDNNDITDVISDMKMNGMNGLEFILKAQKHFPEKNYYLLSGFEMSQDVRKALKQGDVLEYFKKPCNFQRIIKVLKDNHNLMNSRLSQDNNPT